ncbi:hypothetical protein N3K66_001825 [Trichothecium roseum]|uniref:Uncharacterized protein n=1 Tax=Trichothecium roseum TaxID=47278 RepID=A0ACC0V8M0_9HYPO|nr:hypothetical protein N3K66_001825 [Trichothecium roseum]
MESFSSFPSTGGGGGGGGEGRWHADVQLVIDKAELEHMTSFYHGEDGLLRGLADGEVEVLARLLMVPGSLGARPRRQGLLRWLEGQKREIACLPEALRGRRSSSWSGGLQDSIRRVIGYERRQPPATRYSLCSWHRGLDGRLAYAIKVLVRREAVFRCLVFAGYRGQRDPSSPSASPSACELGTAAAKGLELIAHVGDMVGGGLDGPENPARSVVLMAASEGGDSGSGSKKGVSLLLEACAGCDACTVAQVGGSNGAAVAALQASILSRNRFDVEVKGRKRRESRLLGVTSAWLRAREGEGDGDGYGRYVNLVRAFADELFEARRIITMTESVARGCGGAGDAGRDGAVVPRRRTCPLPARRGTAAGRRAGDEEEEQQQQQDENEGEDRVSDAPPVLRWSRPALSPIAVESLFSRIGDNRDNHDGRDNGDLSTKTYTPWRPYFASSAPPARVQSTDVAGDGDHGARGTKSKVTTQRQQQQQRQRVPPQLRRRAGAQDLQGRETTEGVLVSRRNGMVPVRVTIPQQNQQNQENRQRQRQQFVPKLIRKPAPIRRRPVPASAAVVAAEMEAKTGKEPDAVGETAAMTLEVEAGDAHLVPEPLMLSRGAKQRQYLSVPPSTDHHHQQEQQRQEQQQHRRRWSTATDDQVDAGAESNDAVVSKLLVLADEEMRAWTRHFRGSAGLRPLSLVGNGGGGNGTVNE